jgi:hypothetical protein
MVLPPASRRLLIWRSLAHRRFSESPCAFTVIAEQLNCKVQHVTKTRNRVLVAVGIICMSTNTNTNYHTITCCRFCFRNLVVNFAELFIQNMGAHCTNNTAVSTDLTETLGPKLFLVWTVSLKRRQLDYCSASSMASQRETASRIWKLCDYFRSVRRNDRTEL